MYKIVRNTYHPVVDVYMDIIAKACTMISGGCEVIEYKSKQSKKDFIVVDSPMIFLFYGLRGYKNMITWYQGVLPEESYLKNKSKLRCIVLEMIERFALKKSKFNFFVSEEMRKHYEKKYRINLSDNSFVMPCFNELKLSEDAFENPVKYQENTFVYLGGLQDWQCFEQTVDLYKKIEDNSSKPTKFYVFSGSKEKAIGILEKYGVKNYAVDSVPADELSERIKHIKYGFVLREDTPINNVATPTKFSNYVGNGIIPIYSSCIRSFAEYDKSLELGTVYDLQDEKTGLDNILSHMERTISPDEIHTKCKKVFSEYYNAEKYVADIAEKLKKL